MAALNGCSIEQAAIATQPYIEEVVLTLTAHFALTSDGDVLSWGENEQGVLGLGYSSGEVVKIPQKIEIGEPVKKIVTSSLANTVFAVTTSGKVYGWGSNAYKIISSENTPIYYSPVLMDFGIPVAEIKLSHYLVTIAEPNGKIFGLGWTQKGASIHPKQESAFLASSHDIMEINIDSGEPISQIENSVIYRAFINSKNEVFVQGALVENKIMFEKATQVPFPEPIIQIGPMFQGLVGLSETGKLYFIGEDRFGIVGDDTSEYFDIYEEAVLIDKISVSIKDISVSSSSIIVHTEKGDFYTWGYNLGKNNSENEKEIISIPTKLDFNENVRYYYCGEFSNVLITKSHDVYVWGSNAYYIYMDESREASYQPTKINILKQGA